MKARSEFKNGEHVLACVAEMGARGFRPAFSHSLYEFDDSLKSGFRFVRKVTRWMGPSKANYAIAAEIEKEYESRGVQTCEGRPSFNR